MLGSTSPKLAEHMTKTQYQKMEDQEGLQSVSLTNKLVRLVNRKLSYELSLKEQRYFNFFFMVKNKKKL